MKGARTIILFVAVLDGATGAELEGFGAEDAIPLMDVDGPIGLGTDKPHSWPAVRDGKLAWPPAPASAPFQGGHHLRRGRWRGLRRVNG